MASVGVKVFGERRLSEQLEGIQKAMATEIAREATDQAAQILQAAARQNLNVRSGKGRQSVKRRRAKRTKDKTATEVYSDYRELRPDGYYTAYLEHGFGTRSGSFIDEYAWMEPAFDQVLPQMVAKMQQVVRIGVQLVAARTTTRRAA